MARLNKREAVKLLRKKNGLSTVQAETQIENVLGVIQESLENGDTVHLRGLGLFAPITRKSNVGRDFAKGENIIIPATRTVKFTPSARIKRKLNN